MRPDQRRHLVPIALPGMLRKVPGWLMDRLGPLTVDPRYFPKALPWLLRWIEAGRMPRVLKISDAMRAMHSQTFECWKNCSDPTATTISSARWARCMFGKPNRKRPVLRWSEPCANARAFAPSG
jgi:hypothetical protein